MVILHTEVSVSSGLMTPEHERSSHQSLLDVGERVLMLSVAICRQFHRRIVLSLKPFLLQPFLFYDIARQAD